MAKEDYAYHEVHGSNGKEVENCEWWNEPKGQAHGAVFNMTRKIHEQTELKTTFVKNARFYNNQNLISYAHDLTIQTKVDLPSYKPRYNLIKSAIDSLANRIAKARPRPFFLTTKGNYSLKSRAKKLQQYVDGWFDYEKVYPKSKLVFRDACVFKCGFMKLFVRDGKLCCERVSPFEISVEDIDGMYEDPKNIYQTKWITKTALKKAHPKHAEAIDKAKTKLVNSETEVCEVKEAWRVKERHVMCIDGATLVDEPYSKKYFPFAVFRYEHELLGYWGEDLVGILQGMQSEIDKIMRRISDSVDRIAVPRVFLHSTSKVPTQQITNKVGKFVNWTGSTPPIFDTPTAVNPEVYQYLQWLIDTGYKEIGLSQLAATSEKPKGLSSGKALRTYQDIESDRFSNIAQSWDEFFLLLSDIAVDMSKDLYGGKDVPVSVMGEKFIEAMPWSKISMPRDAYTMRVFSTALLPTQPAAKMESVRELAEIGAIPKAMIIEMLDFPDLEAFKAENIGATTKMLTEYHIDMILDDGDYYAPDPAVNVMEAYQMANSRLIEAQTMDVPADRMEMLARYVTQLQELQPPPPMAMAGQAGQTEGVEMGGMNELPAEAMGALGGQVQEQGLV